MNTFAYEVGEGLYVNLTNRCPCSCVFCIRTKGASAYGSESLWLDHEPTADEAFAAIEQKLNGHKEIVFCGFGEPTERLETLLEVARRLRATHPDVPIRVNTNGLSDLIHGKPTAALFEGLADMLSISLNAATPEEYLAICRPTFGLPAHAAMLAFAKEAKKYVKHVVFSIVRTPDLTPEKESACLRVAESVGVPLRVRTFVS